MLIDALGRLVGGMQRNTKVVEKGIVRSESFLLVIGEYLLFVFAQRVVAVAGGLDVGRPPLAFTQHGLAIGGGNVGGGFDDLQREAHLGVEDRVSCIELLLVLRRLHRCSLL